MNNINTITINKMQHLENIKPYLNDILLGGTSTLLATELFNPNADIFTKIVLPILSGVLIPFLKDFGNAFIERFKNAKTKKTK